MCVNDYVSRKEQQMTAKTEKSRSSNMHVLLRNIEVGHQGWPELLSGKESCQFREHGLDP